jgi:4-coumarate--CoA ligase
MNSKLSLPQELIKVRGFQVAPAEIEAVLFDHPNILEAAIVGVQSSVEISELPRAYIVTRPGATLTVQEVRDYASKRLARYKNLDGGIKFVDSIPRNSNGKVLKNVLREQAKREIGARF